MMPSDILERLRARGDRRSFLRGSAMLVAGIGVGAVAPLDGWAQQPPEPAPPPDETRREKDPPEQKRDQTDNADASGKTDKPGTKDTAKEGDGEKTYVGADGRPYRVCPVCGANMYRQERTWTCENCGYSYVE